MNAWLQVDERRRRGVDDAGQPYVEVTFEAIAAYGVSPAVFVHDARRDTFLYVALLDHLGSLLDARTDAIREGYAAYRTSSVTQRYASDTNALAFARHVRTRLAELLAAVNDPGEASASDAVPGSTTHVFGGDP